MYIIDLLKGKDKKVKVFFDNLISLSALQIISYILPLITLPYLVRVLGADKFGLVAFATSFIVYFQIFTDYGFTLSATREISLHRDDIGKVSEIFSSVMMVKLILLVLSFVLLVIIVFSIPLFSSDWLLYLVTFGTVLGNFLFPSWFFQGMERMRYITILNIVSSLIFTVFIFILVGKPSDYIYVPLLTSLGLIVAGVISLRIIIKDFKIKIHKPETDVIIKSFKDSTDFFLSRASISIYTSSNAFFLGLVTSNAMVGYYSAAERLYVAAQGLYQPLINALYPFMSKNKDINFFKNIFNVTLLVTVVFSVLLFIFSPQIVHLLFGNGFQDSVLVLQIFSIALLVTVISSLIGYPFLAAFGHQKYANGSVIISSIFHISILLVMLLFYREYLTIYFVPILVVITTSLSLSIRIYGIQKKFKLI